MSPTLYCDGARFIRLGGGGSAPPVGVAPVITTLALNAMTDGVVFSQTLVATSAAPVTWNIVDGALPDGITLNMASGVLAGTPAGFGAYEVTIRATNVFGWAERTFAGTVGSAPSEDFELVPSWFQGNSGCRIPRNQLTSMSSDPTFSTPNATYTGRFIPGTPRFNKAAYNTFRDCHFEAGYYGILDNTGDAPGLVLENCTFECGSWTNSVLIMSPGARVTRCDIYGGQDGMKVGGSTLVEETYIHDLDTSDPEAHTDGIQVIGGADGIQLRNNWVECPNTGCVSIFSHDGTYRDITLDGNYFGGGAGYLIYAGGSSTTNMTVTNNAFGAYGYGVVSQWPTSGASVWSGNYDYATGNPINP